MSDPVSWFLIERGWKVVDSGGDEIGTVESVLGDPDRDIFDGIAVTKGMLDRLYLPAEQVGRIEVGTVYAEVQDSSALSQYSG